MLADIGEQRAPRALGKTRVPVTDRNQLQAPVRLQRLDHRPEGVDVRDDGLVRPRCFALERRPDRATASQLEGHIEALEFLANDMDDPIRVASGTGRKEEFEEDIEQVLGIDTKMLQTLSSRAAVCGKSKSTKRSAVGWAHGWPTRAARWPR